MPEAAVVWVETAEELVRDRPDLVFPDRWEREPGGTARGGDRDPAFDQLVSEFRGSRVGVGDLGEVGHTSTGHGRSASTGSDIDAWVVLSEAGTAGLHPLRRPKFGEPHRVHP
ncbi:hypothetical protein M877_08280 [Streptomyces niveus NCIMB 11891]|nr:hypothetical protein M877_08280 [Streptomyces niveus NCIMB 11891]